MLMTNEKELSVYATDSTLGQMETNSLDTAGFVWYLQSESIETRVKYPDNSTATVYLSYILYRSSSLWSIFSSQRFSQPNTVEFIQDAAWVHTRDLWVRNPAPYL